VSNALSKFDHVIPSFVKEQLLLELVDPDGERDVSIDFNEVIKLIDHIEEDAFDVLKCLVSLNMSLHRLALRYREKADNASRELKLLESELTHFYSRKDVENPLYKETKLTTDVIKAAVKKDEGYNRLLEEEVVLDNYRAHVTVARDVASNLLRIAEIIISNTLGNPGNFSKNKADVQYITDAIGQIEKVLED